MNKPAKYTCFSVQLNLAKKTFQQESKQATKDKQTIRDALKLAVQSHRQLLSSLTSKGSIENRDRRKQTMTMFEDLLVTRPHTHTHTYTQARYSNRLT